MKFLKSKVFSWILVFLWMILIFASSSMSGATSDRASKGLISKVAEQIINITNDEGLTDTELTNDKVETISKKLNYPVRKVAHTFVYCVLAFLVLNAFHRSGIENKKYLFAILFCFIYACLDEIHQLFVGRSGQILDVIIDSGGALIGCFIYYIITKFYKDKVPILS